jgi:hypothetical protein
MLSEVLHISHLIKAIPMLLQDAKNGDYVGWDLSHHFSIDDINGDLLDKHYQVVWVYKFPR